MQFKNKENECVETVDGKKVWKSRSVAVCCVLYTSDDHFIVTKRSMSMENNPGKMCLVCGFLDNNESIHQALIREVYEESGLDIDGMTAMLYHISDAAISEMQNISFHFFVKLPYGKEKAERLMATFPSEEVEEAYFLTEKDIAADVIPPEDWAYSHYDRLKRVLKIEPQNQLEHTVKLDQHERSQFPFWIDKYGED